MLIWPAKDPDEVLDYRWAPQIDAGDTIATITLDRVSGDVVREDRDASDTAGLTIWLSGGSVGSNLFHGLATTAQGRTFEEYISLEVAEIAPSTLVSMFLRRNPAFGQVRPDDIAYWLADADRYVTDAWGADADPARMAYAVHKMLTTGTPGIIKSDAENLPAGVTQFRSASVNISISETVANRSAIGGWNATAAGQEFALYLRRHNGMPRLVGVIGCRW